MKFRMFYKKLRHKKIRINCFYYSVIFFQPKWIFTPWGAL